MFGKAMKTFFKHLSPKRRIAALVDAVIDRINEKYRAEVEVKIVDGGMKLKFRIVDMDPADHIDLPADDEED